MTLRRRLALVAALLLAVAGCGIQTDAEPRDIPPEDRRDLSAPAVAEPGQLTGAARIYLVETDRSGERSRLRAVNRDVPNTAIDVVRALLAGPTATEQEDRLRTTIPEGTTLNSAAFVSPGTLALDLSSEIFDATGDVLIDAVAQLVFTASELDRVSRVRLLVDGVAQPWPRGDGQLVSEPLTVFDFPDRVASSQPDFPAIPSA